MNPTVTSKELKFPKFIGHMYSQGITLHTFVEMLKKGGYGKDYNLRNVRSKLNGDTKLHSEDIITFAKTLDVPESIFFN